MQGPAIARSCYVPGMNFIFFDLGNLQEGTVVEVQLSMATNVRLMDSYNYDLYQNNHKYKFTGGYVKISPYRVAVPADGHWVLTLDMPASGNLKHTVKVLPKKLADA